MSKTAWLTLLLWVPACLDAEVLIATAGPMTGSHAWSGEQFRRGARLAVEDLNRAGGLLGAPLRLLIGDDAGNPAQAAAVAEKLSRDGVRLVVGHRASDASLAAREIYARAGVVQVSPSSTHPQLTEGGYATVFRVCGRDDRQGRLAGRFLAERWGRRTIGIVHDGSAYGRGLAERTRESLREAGANEVLFRAYVPERTDYAGLLADFQRHALEVVYLGGYSTDAGLIMRQAWEAGLQLQLVAGDALHNADFSLIAGAAAENALFTFDEDPRELREARDVVARLRRQGYEPEGYTLHTYAAVQLWAAAVERAGSLAADAVARAIRQAPIETVLGPLSFDAKGDRREHRYRWYRWQGGRYARYLP